MYYQQNQFDLLTLIALNLINICTARNKLKESTGSKGDIWWENQKKQPKKDKSCNRSPDIVKKKKKTADERVL